MTAMIFFHIILYPAFIIYDFHIFMTSSSSFHRFIISQFNDLLLVGLLAQLVERCTGIAEVKGFEFLTSLNFFGLSFATANVVSIRAMIFFHMIFHPAVLIHDFHIFLTSDNYIV